MDAAHEAELARILAKRQSGGRILTGAGAGAGGAGVAPVAMTKPLHAPAMSPDKSSGAPSPTVLQQKPAAGQQNNVSSGAIVIEDDKQQQQQQQHRPAVASAASAPAPALNVVKKSSIPAPSASSYVTPPKAQTQTHQASSLSSSSYSRPGPDADLANVLQEIQIQNRIQAEQLKALQSSVDTLVRNNSPPNANAQRYGHSPPPPPHHHHHQQSSAASPGVTFSDQHQHHAAPPPPPPPPAAAISRGQEDAGRAPSIGADGEPLTAEQELAKSLLFQDAAALGLVVKPRSIATSAGGRIVSFRSPSRNSRSTMGKSRSVQRSAGGGGGGGGSRAMSSPPGGAGVASPMTHRGGGGGGGGGATSPSVMSTSRGGGALVTTQRGVSETSFRMPRAAHQETIAKPFSSSTIDIDSAVVLLTTGEWFYKVRVDVKSASLVGPAGWDIQASARRYVYLDTTTFILRWGDKPGGDATLWSHYVPIDQIVNINIYAQSEQTRGPTPRTVYYIVLHVVEGGFHARGRATQRRLCVFATELRDKADMWFDALQAISTFYKGRGLASSVAARTFSSD